LEKNVTENFAVIPNASALKIPNHIFCEDLVKYIHCNIFEGNIPKYTQQATQDRAA
jgi:hypothetical protein